VAERGQGVSAGLSRAAIVDAALRIADEHGLRGLSMRAVAAELNVEAMSLYNHVANKEALLDALVERMDAEATGSTGDQPWEDQLRTMALAFRRTMHRHPEIAKLFATRPTVGPSWARAVELTLRAFADAGLSGRDGAYAYRVFWAYLTGYVIREVRQTTAPPLNAQIEGLPEADYPLTRQLPKLIKVRDDAEFVRGMDLVLGALVQRSA
jgi:AcrR family transcriptional regulator